MTQTQVDKRCGRRFKEARCETMENESIEQRGVGINYKGSQGRSAIGRKEGRLCLLSSATCFTCP